MVTQSRPWLAKYPPDIPPSLTYPTRPLDSLLRDTAAKFPDATATIFFGARLTYRELNDAADAFAGALARLGVQKDDRVALLMPNMPPFVIAYYGTVRLGAIVVQLNPLLTTHELRAELQDSGATVLVAAEPVLDKAAEAVKDTAVRHLLVTSLAAYVPLLMRPFVKLKTRPQGEVRIPTGVQPHDLEALLRTGSRPPRVDFDPKEQVAVFQYTGGTTGLPKAAMLTHFNLLANAHQIAAWVARLKDGEEVFLCILPFFHSYGMTVGMNLAILKAGVMVLLPRFDPTEAAKAIAQHKVTLFPGVPSLYAAVAHSAERQHIDISSVKVCVSGGAPLPLEVHERFVKATGAKLVEGYGLSEASPVTHCNPIWDGENRIGTIGLPLPDTDCKIVDVETGERTLPPNEAGELVIKGPQVMKGYWNRPDETAQTLRDGWLYTGDIATMDPEGYFRIVDRKKDLVIVGGFNVYPREVEEVLYQHPKVLEAAVVGVTHPVRGETVKAFVVLKEGVTATEAELIAFCRDHLASYKVPREIEFVKELPKSAVGKVLRRELRRKGEKPSA
ncbi:Long-chain-fatty-acid--CoA ligase [bacterium HR17]|jgi:long-chain acyl-CoA synthetase|uniref:Long-chain-fatty-acid--CoA ligase n=1 Tax=Candidatus Fervidibacter japonicus TaxID=2035412 RepID=A0A2H5X9U5_9BACT|nr:Long-chain-fatty-acid--CoA ligase [bacterium HR17]